MSRIDITGQRFGKLIALEPTDKRYYGYVVWKCRCDCGNECEVPVNSLRQGHTQSCGCSRIDDITGQRFGRLVALEPTDKRSGSATVWKCQCDCGNICEVRGAHLRSGRIQSCGCLVKKDITGQRFGKLIALEPTDKRSGNAIVWKCKCDCGNECEVSVSSLLQGGTQSCGCSRIDDITGQRFGKLTAIEPTDKRCGSSVVWKCKCDCGNVCEVAVIYLRQGTTQSCGCIKESEYVENTCLFQLSQKLRKNNTSGRRGVCWDSTHEKWSAYITFQNKRIRLGRFKKYEDAVKARELAEDETFEPMLNKYGKSLDDEDKKDESEE